MERLGQLLDLEVEKYLGKRNGPFDGYHHIADPGKLIIARPLEVQLVDLHLIALNGEENPQAQENYEEKNAEDEGDPPGNAHSFVLEEESLEEVRLLFLNERDFLVV